MATARDFLAAALLLLCTANPASAEGYGSTAGIGRRGLSALSERDMAAYCGKSKNQLSSKCTEWVHSHEEFQDRQGKAALLQALLADTSSEVGPDGSRSAGTHWDVPRAHRMAMYASAARCKFSALKEWNCTTCKRITNTVLLAAHEDSVKGHPDAFYITFDKELNAIVATFRSTCETPAPCPVAATVALQSSSIQQQALFYAISRIKQGLD